MIKGLRRKFVLIVMTIVTLILLAIFFTMLFSTKRNNEKMSENMLQQALFMRAFPSGMQPNTSNRPPVGDENTPNMRLPILILEVDKDGDISVVSNQLHFIEQDDIEPIAELALSSNRRKGNISEYNLRYLQNNVEDGVRIAFADISVEQELLKSLVVNSLLVGGSAMLIFFFLSIILARWAVRPMEVAWERQKQFVANASHELKTPLTVILSNADMLRKSELGGDEKNVLRTEHIHAEARRMKRLVEDMLTLAKSDNSQVSNLNAAVDFSYIIKSAVLIYEPIVYDEKKALSYDIEDGLIVTGDMAGLQQVAHILLDNAQKYSPQGGSIHVCMKRGEQHSLLLKVTNSGVPIPPNELNSIFLRFNRRDESRSEHGGFGLGLSIAQSIISEHKGKMWAESDEKAGNSFFVALPIS